MKKKNLIFLLGNLTAFGPFVTDFYLPCLPELTAFFSATPSLVQLSITAGMIGLAAGQLLIGPISDKYGRKRPLLVCLVLFVLSTLGCMISTDIHTFVAFRLLQGLTGASGLVISKVIISDSFSGEDTARYFAILAAVQGIAPIVAPVAGGLAYKLTSWQGAFALLGIWAVALLFMCRKMRESLPAEERLTLPIWGTFRNYGPVICNSRYSVMNLLQGFATAALMAYIAASPFVFQQHFGLTPFRYSLCFACNALGLVIGSSVVIKMKDLRKVISMSVAGLFVTGGLTAAALLAGWSFLLFEVFLFLMLFAVGMINPVAVTLALGSVKENRGAAAALVGALPFLFGGIIAPLTGLGNIVRSMAFLIVLSVLICVVLWLISRKWKYEETENRR
ncbi:MAG: Bcr/CflA family efflux MFS transporter [Bacteroidales bacterium]|nr:Bcr/CflA family efflux MFS transporter [Bacteroidales bacterium]MDE7073078.1 Bcr/CflA family efflux MFS transporter [Bacteroidales bacterium]